MLWTAVRWIPTHSANDRTLKWVAPPGSSVQTIREISFLRSNDTGGSRFSALVVTERTDPDSVETDRMASHRRDIDAEKLPRLRRELSRGAIEHSLDSHRTLVADIAGFHESFHQPNVIIACLWQKISSHG